MKTTNYSGIVCILSFLLLFSVSCKKDKNGPPEITTGDVTSITVNSAQASGNITSDGGSAVTMKGICWNTEPSPDTTDFKTSNGGGTGSFSVTLSNLAIYTTYYVRAYAINAYGISYGQEKSFNTSAYPQQIDGIPSDRYQVALNDDFDNNNNGWYIQSDNNIQLSITNGYYTLRSISDYCNWFWGSLSSFPVENDFELETTLKIVPQGLSADEAGALIWNVTENSFTAAMLFSNNSMWYGNYAHTWQTWNAYNSLSALNPAGQSNKITVRKFNAVYYFFINNQFIFSRTWEPFSTMSFGFLIQTHVLMMVDNIKISRISPATGSNSLPVNKMPLVENFNFACFKGIPYKMETKK